MMVFDERLGILRDGNVISAEVESLVKRAISRLEERWKIMLTEEAGGRMVTHLAMALMRIKRHENIPAPETDVMNEFRGMDAFFLSETIVNDLIEWTPMELPDSEKKYMIVNLCLLLDS